VSLIGPNGAGKTTLIHTLTGRHELAAGKLRRGHNVKVGLLSQHAEELGAKGARTVLEAAQRSTGLKPNEARSLLGKFLFSGEAAEKPLDGLSGGERRRLSLAILVHSGANVLVLDEPTNHLDLESREALEAALQAFPGSLLLISHDRALLDAVGTRTVAVEDGTLKIGERTLIEHFDLWLERGEHVSLIGPNGTGKTTLIHTLTGEHELTAGKLRRGHNVKVGLLSQHAEELGAKGARTVLEAAQRSTGLKPNEARSLLGRFLFSGEAAEKPLDGLSGGERRRLSLAILVHSGANVLVLDEPTNHLDLESREALEAALQAFPGSLLLVSHDRALLDAVGTRTVAVEDGTLRSYVGGWPEYLRVREERAEAEKSAKRAKPAKRTPVKPAEPKPSNNQLRQAKKIEAEIEAAETELRKLEEELADPAAWNDPRTAAKSSKRHEQAKRALQALYAEWEAVAS